MFKKFFTWIIDTFKRIGNYIHDMKVKEFRHKRKIYDIPEDFHTNPKYKVYEELIPFYIPQFTFVDKIFMFMLKKDSNIKLICRLVLTFFVAIGSISTIIIQKII